MKYDECRVGTWILRTGKIKIILRQKIQTLNFGDKEKFNTNQTLPIFNIINCISTWIFKYICSLCDDAEHTEGEPAEKNGLKSRFTYNLVGSNLKQKVADLVKRIRLVFRTCRELLADLWNRFWTREWWGMIPFIFYCIFFKSQTTKPFKETRVLNSNKHKRSEASDVAMWPSCSVLPVPWGSSRWGCRCRQWWRVGWWTGTLRRISCTWTHRYRGCMSVLNNSRLSTRACPSAS